MAGTLAGVECARRRRLGSSDSAPAFTRKPTFCLYATNYETHAFSQQRSVLIQASQDQKLGDVAREAKERLDERLRSQRKSEPKRQKNSKEETLIQGELRREVFVGSKKRLNWAKLSRKASNQDDDSDDDECVICLERFKAGESLGRPPCEHRFHSRCLVPWLQNNAYCPCCRLGISS